MPLGFIPVRRRGVHYDLALFAVKRLRRCNLKIKGRNEREFEHAVVANLTESRKLAPSLITQVDDEPVEKISQATLFGFKHRPDTTIGKDGTAIEIKVITSGQSIREVLGQSIAYRMHYRFVIAVLVDQKGQVVQLCTDKNSQESDFLTGLARDFNIFTVVGPVDRSKNLAFWA